MRYGNDDQAGQDDVKTARDRSTRFVRYMLMKKRNLRVVARMAQLPNDGRDLSREQIVNAILDHEARGAVGA